MSALRYGSVPFLNTRPLLEGLEDEVGPLTLACPGDLARMLLAGEVDVALAPVVVSFAHEDLVIVPADAVVARGPVRSVLLFAHGPPAGARRIGLDTSSRTSAALLRVLYAHHWNARPDFVGRAPDPDLQDVERGTGGLDACLLIGDPALRARWDGPEPVDLGSVWWDWTGLPFVFAAWVARNADIAARALEPLRRAGERGEAALAHIAATGARDLGLTPEVTERYLRHHLSFRFGETERAGLARFRELWETLPAEIRSLD